MALISVPALFFIEEAVAKEAGYRVDSFSLCNGTDLVARVSKKSDPNDVRTCEAHRDDSGNICVSCPCLMFEEKGFPCGRLLKMLNVANYVR